MKTQFKTQEDDRDYLIRQLVAVKKDNARLRQEITSLREETEVLKAAANDNVGAALTSPYRGVLSREVFSALVATAYQGCRSLVQGCIVPHPDTPAPPLLFLLADPSTDSHCIPLWCVGD